MWLQTRQDGDDKQQPLMRDTQAGESGAVEQRARSHLLAIENALFDVLVCFF